MKFWKLASTALSLSLSVNTYAASYSIDTMNIMSGGFVAYDHSGQAVVNTSAGSTYTPFTTFGVDTNLVGNYLGNTTNGFVSATWFGTSVQFYSAASNLGSSSYPQGSIQGGIVPSGILNDTSDTITMNLSSIFAYWGGSDFHQGTGKNDGITSLLATGDWESTTGFYSLSWISNIDPSVCGPLGSTCSAEYTIEGYAVASVVPVPSALWLFGSGLIGLVGFARRKQVLKAN